MHRLNFWDVGTPFDFMRADGTLYLPPAEEIIPTLVRMRQCAHTHGIRVVASGERHGIGCLTAEETSRKPQAAVGRGRTAT